jgi:predicted translin family RNA/ssDNA-binding protein
MLNAAVAQKLIKKSRDLDRRRRELQSLSSEVLAASKRAIFAMHRMDQDAAERELAAAQVRLRDGWKIVKTEARLAQEGMWRAAQEEYAEASLFLHYVQYGNVKPVAEISDDPDIFLGALSDLTGEIVRRAVLLASDRHAASVQKMVQDVGDVVSFLLQMDLTGSVRQKVDQARQNLRKMEEIRYDLSLA